MRALRAAAADCEPAEEMRPGGRSDAAPGPNGCWLRLVATAVFGEGDGDEEVAAAAAAANGFKYERNDGGIPFRAAAANCSYWFPPLRS